MKYETVIGLEVHAQLLTNSKIFCGCSAKFGNPPNSQTCPVCMGYPGVLPVLNEKVLEYAIKASLATNCHINEGSRFARKNYFYPDLPKSYQISQYEAPLAEKGFIEITVNEERKKIEITRIHLEEDAGKLVHTEGYVTSNKSFADFNRTGVPLIEIVSEPDLRSPQEAREYVRKIRTILQYLEVCDGNMEEGSLRCDANISLRPVGSKILGTKTELKNLNSFRFIQKALEYEINRQCMVLEAGEKVIQETRLWDPDQNRTFSMRTKEEAHDYRYFPDPDLVPFSIESEMIHQIKAGLPELPEIKIERFIREYEIPGYDAEILASSRELADYFEACAGFFSHYKMIGNWIMGELIRELRNHNRTVANCPVTPEILMGLLKMIDEGIISGKIAKYVFEEMFKTGKSAEQIVKEKNLIQISDQKELEEIIDKIVAENPKVIEDVLSGKKKAMGFLVGKVMKATSGKANPGIVNQILKKKL